jgi:NADPH2:quinone reductase
VPARFPLLPKLTWQRLAITMVREAHVAKAGEYILVHAAAGGMGLLLCQMYVLECRPSTAIFILSLSVDSLKHLGVHVIGTTSTEEKAKLAKKAGAEHIVLYSNRSLDDVVKEIKALTPGG